MADKIVVNTDVLSSWSRELSAVADKLGDAAAVLDRLDTGDSWWRRVSYRDSFTLRDEGSSQSMSSFRDAAQKYAAVLRRYDARVQQLSGAVSKASSYFEDVESGIVSMVDALGRGEGQQNNTGAQQSGNLQMESKTPQSFFDKLKQVLGPGAHFMASNSPIGFFFDGYADFVRNGVEGALDKAEELYDDYKNKGTTFKVIKTIGATGKIAISTVATVATWIGTGVFTVGTAGAGGTVSIPLAVLESMYAANEIASSFTDIYNCWWGDVNKVGEVNYMKDACVYSYGEIGEALGNREAGEAFGKGIYNTGELIQCVSEVEEAAGKLDDAIETAGSTKKLASETAGTVRDTVKTIVTPKPNYISEVKKQIDAAKPAKETISNGWTVIENSWKIGEIKYETQQTQQELMEDFVQRAAEKIQGTAY